MKTVIFHNPSLLDIRGAMILGLSAKDDEAAIGKFGTGLKYAIACILRWNGQITISIDSKEYKFTAEELDFRGKQFSQVMMNGEPLGFTTHYGMNWEPWMVFRELYSNAKDENGGVLRGDACVNYADSTVIRVVCEKVAECYAERDTIIFPIGCMDQMQGGILCARMPSNFLYYKGVRVRSKKCLFTWNLNDGVDLTEDRSITDTWEFTHAMGAAIQASTDTDFINKCLTSSDHYIEADAGYSRYNTTSKEFLDAAQLLWKQNPEKMNYNAKQVLLHLRSELTVSALIQLNKTQQQMLDKAIRLVKLMDMPVDEYPIEVRDLGKNTLGQAKDGKVLLSPEVFAQGTKQVVSTLYEEVLHLSTGLTDCNYEMQTHLFNKIVSLYEEHVFGEPC